MWRSRWSTASPAPPLAPRARSATTASARITTTPPRSAPRSARRVRSATTAPARRTSSSRRSTTGISTPTSAPPPATLPPCVTRASARPTASGERLGRARRLNRKGRARSEEWARSFGSAAAPLQGRRIKVTMPPAFAIEHVQTSADQGEIRIRGSLRLAEAAPLWTELRRLETGASRGQTLDFEMSAVQRIDGGAMALLACLRAELHRRGVKSEFVAADARVQQIIHLYGGDNVVRRLRSRRPLGTLDQLGRATISILH